MCGVLCICMAGEAHLETGWIDWIIIVPLYTNVEICPVIHAGSNLYVNGDSVLCSCMELPEKKKLCKASFVICNVRCHDANEALFTFVYAIAGLVLGS